jgi:hypothetical protein
MKDIRRKIAKQEKEWLVDRLVELAIADDTVADRIILSLAAQDEGGPKFIAKFKRQLDKAARTIENHGPGSWGSEVPTTAFDAVADTLAIMGPAFCQEVLEISEYALIKLDGVFELQNECELEYLIDAFRALHIDACQKLGPDPSVLAVRLAELGQQTEWGFFDGPPDGYVEILGQDGIKTFVAALSIASKSRSKSNK